MDIVIIDLRSNIILNTFFADNQLLVINKVFTTCYNLSHKLLNTTIIDKPYAASDRLCSLFLFHNSFSK